LTNQLVHSCLSSWIFCAFASLSIPYNPTHLKFRKKTRIASPICSATRCSPTGSSSTGPAGKLPCKLQSPRELPRRVSSPAGTTDRQMSRRRSAAAPGLHGRAAPAGADRHQEHVGRTRSPTHPCSSEPDPDELLRDARAAASEELRRVAIELPLGREGSAGWRGTCAGAAAGSSCAFRYDRRRKQMHGALVVTGSPRAGELLPVRAPPSRIPTSYAIAPPPRRRAGHAGRRRKARTWDDHRGVLWAVRAGRPNRAPKK
jgi:hypothetical protein